MKKEDVKVGAIVYEKTAVSPLANVDKMTHAYEIVSPDLTEHGYVRVISVTRIGDGWVALGFEFNEPLDELLTKDQLKEAIKQAGITLLAEKILTDVKQGKIPFSD